MDGVDQRRARALIPAMVRNDEEVHRAEPIFRTHQVALLVPCEIAEIEYLQIAEADQNAKGTRVLRLIERAYLALRAVCIRLAGTRQWFLDHLAVCADDGHVQSFNRQTIAGLRYDFLRLGLSHDLLKR